MEFHPPQAAGNRFLPRGCARVSGFTTNDIKPPESPDGAGWAEQVLRLPVLLQSLGHPPDSRELWQETCHKGLKKDIAVVLQFQTALFQFPQALRIDYFALSRRIDLCVNFLQLLVR